ncbi:MAG: exodeoxyribonuclease VII small subunit [Bacteroidales bacterium]|nr:exodeoxyribonuclease VII small subunit [Bacteroidales bacterium]
MENKELTYEEAYLELQNIVKEIEDNNIGLDTLEQHLKRASCLIDYCQEKLKTVEIDINKLIADLEK